jgi:hypothetical protein
MLDRPRCGFFHWIDEVVSKAARDPMHLPKRCGLLRLLDLEADRRGGKLFNALA